MWVLESRALQTCMKLHGEFKGAKLKSCTEFAKFGGLQLEDGVLFYTAP